MGKQYISTNSVRAAHKLDILDLAVLTKYTVTVGSDGYVQFWDNKLDENQDPKDHVVNELIDKSGIHHVNVYENQSNFDGEHIKVVVIGYGCLSGHIKFQYFLNDDIKTLKAIETPKELTQGAWTPIFHKDPQSEQDYMIATLVSGRVLLYKLNFERSKEDLSVSLSMHAELATAEKSFPISVDVTQSTDRKISIGYANGEVLLCSLDNLKVVYTFHSTDLQVSSKSTSSNSVPRVVKFSPGGTLLVVARDNQNSGSLTLYDVKYGENVGSLTTPSHSANTSIGGFAHNGWIMGLSFNDEGTLLASCGFDKCVRIWNLENKEREATLNISASDFDLTGEQDEQDTSVASGVCFIKKGIRGGLGGDNNDGICVISFDRGVRWYREAGGI